MGPCRKLALLLPIAVSAACDQGATLNRTPPFIAASTLELDFGEREVGSTEARSIFLINKGQIQLNLELPDGDSLNGVFSVRLDKEAVLPEDEAVLEVRFSPFDPQPYETFFTIPNNSSNEETLVVTLRGTGVPRDPCAGVSCATPPAPICITQNSSRRYEPLGVCADGRCEHNYVDEECDRGCNDDTGTCRGDPCAGVACNTPPSACFFASGMCREGACEYVVNNEGTCDDEKPCTLNDRCAEGACVGDQIVCDTPPEALCVDATTRRFWSAQGVCNQGSGACEYMQQEQQCQFGCTDGVCNGDPCAGVVCDQPPFPACYLPMGTCNNGTCSYTAVSGPCDDGDACTNNDVCNNGTCAGTPQVCTTPPPSVCADGTTLEVYNMNGTCNAGTCEYPVSQITCNDSDACTVGDFCNAGQCRSGAVDTCGDNNACTADMCDPVSGCSNPPISGGACTTTSQECPTGTCSSGTCLPTAGVTCLATYEICLGLVDQDVAGVCTAAGECVVTQAPPQFTCPGCQGLCFVCPIIGSICIPFN
ncbi:MAG: hypothetical protein RIT81_32745 [Deltaproteobacteria bacterium]